MGGFALQEVPKCRLIEVAPSELLGSDSNYISNAPDSKDGTGILHIDNSLP